MTEIDRIRDAIRKMHHAESRHVESVPVKDMLAGQTVWDGTVEVFDIESDDPATRLYAWVQTLEDGKKRVVTVLHRHQIESAKDAVRAAILKLYGETTGSDSK